MFFSDTCFWIHAKLVSDKKIYDFRDLLEDFDFGITNQVRKELDYHLQNYLNYNDLFMKPVTTKDFESTRKINPFLEHFDIADQSLFIIGYKFGDVIVSDDRALITECQGYKIRAFHMVDLSLFLVQHQYISKNTAHKIIKFLGDQRVIAKRHYKHLIDQIQKMT